MGHLLGSHCTANVLLEMLPAIEVFTTARLVCMAWRDAVFARPLRVRADITLAAGPALTGALVPLSLPECVADSPDAESASATTAATPPCTRTLQSYGGYGGCGSGVKNSGGKAAFKFEVRWPQAMLTDSDFNFGALATRLQEAARAKVPRTACRQVLLAPGRLAVRL